MRQEFFSMNASNPFAGAQTETNGLLCNWQKNMLN
jgi:hypothetical protein